MRVRVRVTDFTDILQVTVRLRVRVRVGSG